MSRRRITPEELKLWQQVAKTAERLDPKRDTTTPKLLQAKPKSKPETPKTEISPFEIGQTSRASDHRHDTLPGLHERLSRQPLQMDKRTNTRLKRGKVEPEARIDLHGMTLAQAQPALTGFILRAQAQGKRLVLVITGKGKNTDTGGPIPTRNGVLRHAVPQWLGMAPLSGLVLQITQAHVRHGGGGAYYVYLRRNR
ncbi:DNA mismatch repair protein MutS [Roseovarius atlanticus]|uniref:DNA mismatch repair protein MutS n=1 Tax=Roseovarius atlanticus TaxID=1641875 RepID=A0A0T5NRF3_9RHOB|nr:Smr/MutS family protein [Roseovarius atlanticus]KRS11215.1 DNA mismatch repair protein MutS [Roseovarius atlanticus]